MTRNWKLDNILEFTGATYRQLDYWTTRGWLRCPEPKPGYGYHRAWPPDELNVARRMAQLIAAGVTSEAAHYAARHDGWLPGDRFRVECVDDTETHAEGVRRESA